MNYQRSIQIVKTNQNGNKKEVVEETIQQNGKKWTRKIVKTPQHTETYQNIEPVSSSSSHVSSTDISSVRRDAQLLMENDPFVLSLMHRGRMPTPVPGLGSEYEQSIYSSQSPDKTRRRRKKRKTRRTKTSKKNTRKGKGV